MAAVPGDRVFSGQPSGFSVLFATEIGERFSYYGMRALLILYLTRQLGLSDAAAGGIYGDYTGLVYLAPLLGGWLADRYLGLQRSIAAGCVLMAAGHGALVAHAWPRAGAAPPDLALVWLGLLLIVAGSGLFKPNMMTLVGRLYPLGDRRSDAGFTLFYMAINLGALAPFVSGYLSERLGWHIGFLCAGLGAVAAGAVFTWFRHGLGEHGRDPQAPGLPVAPAVPAPRHHAPDSSVAPGLARRVVLALLALLGLLLGAYLAVRAARASGSALEASRAALWPVVFAVVVAVYARLHARCDGAERRRVDVIFLLGLFVILFWAAVEQTGSTLTLFAERYVERRVGGIDLPASFIQGLTPVWILLLAPLFTWLWTRLAALGRDPSAPVKIVAGLLLQVAAYGVMSAAMLGGLDGRRVSPLWLLAFFALQTCGELALSPAGMAMVTRLAPARFAALLMGVWMLSASWANKLAGASAGLLEPLGPARLFPAVTVVLAAVALTLLALLPWIRRQVSGAPAAAAVSGGAPA
jgi:POT family proton-dependent oligopeptide transporter